VVHAQHLGAGKLVRVEEGGKLHRRGGKTHFPHELQTNMPAGRSSSTRPAIRSGKAGKSSSGRKTPQERGEDPLPM
jgi:hypothetical protein